MDSKLSLGTPFSLPDSLLSPCLLPPSSFPFSPSLKFHLDHGIRNHLHAKDSQNYTSSYTSSYTSFLNSRLIYLTAYLTSFLPWISNRYFKQTCLNQNTWLFFPVCAFHPTLLLYHFASCQWKIHPITQATDLFWFLSFSYTHISNPLVNPVIPPLTHIPNLLISLFVIRNHYLLLPGHNIAS